MRCDIVQFGRQITTIILLSPFSEQNERGEKETVQYSTVQYSTVQYSTVQYSTSDLKLY